MGIKVMDTLLEKIKLKIPLSLGEAFAAVKNRKEINKETRKAHDRKEFPIHYTKEEVPDNAKQQKFLEYALHFIKAEHPKYWYVLMLRMQDEFRGPNGNKKIAQFLNTKGFNESPTSVSKIEAEAIRCVKQKIESIRQTGIPIFSEPGQKRASGLIVAGAR